ncbi:MAG: phosphoribosylformylglycinamidine synthase subunit PurQ, partial [Actinobacteria bacterium]|nr:phosphoribosylformylglycinamidine synthase subunit PurQ [Actinomycetota bacterium]
MATNVAVIRFPGTNCEFDVVEVVQQLGAQAQIVFHDEPSLGSADAVVIAGGFAHGDYLRPGAIARFSPVMEAVASFAQSGGPVVGICNGFQVLTEANLLPGALQKNAGLKFRCGFTELRVENSNSVLTSEAQVGEILSIPINHFEGNYTCSSETLAELQGEDRVLFR